MKVLLIDPWGIANTSEYLNGLIFGLDKITNLTVYTNFYFSLKVDADAEINRCFFHKSEHMKRGILRTVIRGFEYHLNYHRIISRIQREKFDVVHINWLLDYKTDISFLRKIKKYTNKLVYTAHNVIPHENGTKYIKDLRKIYDLCDSIILHGNVIRDEFVSLYPEFSHKIYIQKHGSNLFPNTGYRIEAVPEYIIEKTNSYPRIGLFFGLIFYNKGIDRIIKLWDSSWKDCLLIVAGKHSGEYSELDVLNEKMRDQKNILELKGFVDDNTLNYLIDKSSFVLLPYRHASMSGVVFTASDFAKPIMATDTGSIKEYLSPPDDSIVVQNNDKALEDGLNKMLFLMTDDMLKKMGDRKSTRLNSSHPTTSRMPSSA